MKRFYVDHIHIAFITTIKMACREYIIMRKKHDEALSNLSFDQIITYEMELYRKWAVEFASLDRPSHLASDNVTTATTMLLERQHDLSRGEKIVEEIAEKFRRLEDKCLLESTLFLLFTTTFFH